MGEKWWVWSRKPRELQQHKLTGLTSLLKNGIYLNLQYIGNIISPFYATGFQLKIPVSYLI